jgi:hypothetical protein
MYCPHCGSEIKAGRIRCEYCKEKIMLPKDTKEDEVKIGDVPTNLAGAIIVTILCCWIFGIPAIVYAARVNEKILVGDYEGAVEASEKAEFWIIMSVIGGLAALGLFALCGI